jgi:hypothetical protein
MGLAPTRSVERVSAGISIAVGDVDPLLETVVVGLDPVAAAADAELADDGLVRAAENFEDLAFGFAVGADKGDVGEDAVAVHGLRRRWRAG